MALRSPEPPGASFCRGGARPPRRLCPTATAISATARPIRRIGPGLDFDARGRLDMPSAPGAGRAAQCRLLHLRTARLHERSDRRPRSLGRRRKPHPHRDFRRGSVHDPGHRRIAAPAAASAGRASRRGTAGLVRPERPRVSAGGQTFQSLLELAEACDIPVRWSCRTGVCHTCETGLVAGTVSYRPDPIDAPVGRQCADLLLATPGRHRD